MRNRGKLKYIMPILPCNYVRNTNFVREPSRCHFIRPRSMRYRVFLLVTSREHISTLNRHDLTWTRIVGRCEQSIQTQSRWRQRRARRLSFLNGDARFGCSGGVWVTVRPLPRFLDRPARRCEVVGGAAWFLSNGRTKEFWSIGGRFYVTFLTASKSILSSCEMARRYFPSLFIMYLDVSRIL